MAKGTKPEKGKPLDTGKPDVSTYGSGNGPPPPPPPPDPDENPR